MLEIFGAKYYYKNELRTSNDSLTKYNLSYNNMFKLITSILYNPSLIKPDISVSHTRDILSILNSKTNANTEVIDKIKNSKIWIFDKDDTLVPLDQFVITDYGIKQMLYHLMSSSTLNAQNQRQLYVVSNSIVNHQQTKTGMKRTHISFEYDNQQFRIQILALKKKKPFNGEQIMEQIRKNQKSDIKQIKNEDVIIVGDRLFTDVYLGKNMGWNTILVDSIENSSIVKHGIGVKAMRVLQNVLLKML